MGFSLDKQLCYFQGMKSIAKIFTILSSVRLMVLLGMCLLLSSCWAPRCPMKSCHVAMDHRHQGQVYRGGSIFASKMHNPYWYATRNSKQGEGGGLRKNKDPKTKKKFKKLLPWEKV